MDHLFIDPLFHKRGIGQALFAKAIQYCKEQRIHKIMIFVDPNATGFYEKMSASFVEYSPSSIPGRKIPIYEYRLLNKKL